jgi:hypothetical protein
MTEQNLTTTADEIDDIHEMEDVEGHMHRDTDDASEDVEGHMHRDTDDADDDVEGHFRR